MTNLETEAHNALCAELTADDGIPRLTWEQHREAMAARLTCPNGMGCEQFADVDSRCDACNAPAIFTVGQMVVAWDSATPGTVVSCGGLYEIAFPDIDGTSHCRYPASQLRPWPADLLARAKVRS